MRIKYWTCTDFADRLRGTPKPPSATGDEWDAWHEEASTKHPIRYWLAEEGLDKLQKFVYWIPDRFYDVKYYIVNRWIDQTNALVAHPKHIKPGQYVDLDYRILHCLFDELVDFVEIEKAYCNYRWDEEKIKKLKWWQAGRWRTRTWRSAEAGIEHLKWEMSLTDGEWRTSGDPEPTAQANAAKEILELYTWWTEVYPKRPDPMDASGWSEYCADKTTRGIGFLSTDPEEHKWDTKSMHNKMREMEKAYEDEDTEMLVRLIKVRKSLWT